MCTMTSRGAIQLTGWGLCLTQAAWTWTAERSHKCACFLLPADTDSSKRSSEPLDVIQILRTLPGALMKVWLELGQVEGCAASCTLGHPMSSRERESSGALEAPL